MDRKYQAYLLSDEWKDRKNQRIKIEGFRCRMCQGTGTPWNPLTVHHFDYHHVYDEDPWRDLVCLCEACHSRIHWLMNRPTSADGERGWCDTLSYVPEVLAPSMNASRVEVVYLPTEKGFKKAQTPEEVKATIYKGNEDE